jgi:ferredoxin
MRYRIKFQGSDKSFIDLNAGECLSNNLTIQNSPILFGCRIGICGTCAIEVIEADSQLEERTQDENDFLENMAPGNKRARLACQIHINTNMTIRKLDLS